MFDSPPFTHNPFRRLPITSAFSYSNYITPGPMPYLHPQHTHETTRQHRHWPHHRLSSPPPLHQPRRHRQNKHHSYYEDTEPSSSDQNSLDEAYHRDMSPPSPSPLHSRLHARRSWKQTHSTLDMTSAFRRLNAKVSRSAAENIGRDDILILPHALTRLRVQVRSPAHASETLRATVARDMRFRDVVKQLVPEMYHGEVRAYVKMRGAWQEPGLFRVSQIVEQGRFVLNERGELEVKIEIGGRDSGGGMEGGVRGVKAWERERGRTWEIR